MSNVASNITTKLSFRGVVTHSQQPLFLTLYTVLLFKVYISHDRLDGGGPHLSPDQQVICYILYKILYFMQCELCAV